MAQGHHLHLRLFLEGIEVPVVAASVNVGPNAGAAASIQIVATDKVLDLLPRTVVHLFYYDYIGGQPLALDDTGEFVRDDEFNKYYRLYFMGEMVSMQFQKNAGQRVVVLQCVDFSNYWDTTFQYNFNGQLFGGRRQANFIGANSNLLTSPLGHGYGTVSRLLNGRSANFPDLRGLLAGIVRMLEAIGGSYRGRTTFRGCNDFTSIAELRLKILQQITAAEQDTSTARLFSRKAFNMWMNRQIGSLGQLVSFRSLLKMLFQFVYHEVYACPMAKYVPSSTRLAKRKLSVGMDKTGKYKAFHAKANYALNLTILATDALNKWRNSVRTATNSRDITELTTKYVRAWMKAERQIKESYAYGQALNIPATAANEMAIAQKNTNEIRTLSVGNNRLISANYGQWGTLDRNRDRIGALWAKIETALKSALGVQVKLSRSYTEETSDRVNNQIFRPDIFYAPPPRCNVLFPEHYDSFSFARQYLREVTRLELQTHNEILGSHALFNGRYYAPNVEDLRTGKKLGNRRFARVIMDHELFTGIVPMFENMPEANLFAMRSGKVQRGGAKVGYAQRAVNFQYFKYRFESRSMGAAGRFNPSFVPGFPSLIIDKYLDENSLDIVARDINDQLKLLDLKADSPLTAAQILQQVISPQYLGVCSQLSHNMSQEGGRTTYQFIQSRVHRESDEYLGVDKASATRVKGSSFKTSFVAAPEGYAPKKGQKGVKGGTIVTVRDVTKSKAGRFLPLFGGDERVKVGEDVDILYPVAPVSYQETTNQSRRAASGAYIRAYAIRESFPIRVKEDVDFPIEEIIRPPWVWDGWANPKIGKTYAQFFGTTAITDIGGYDANVQSDTVIGGDDLEAARKQQSAVTSAKGSRPSNVSRNDERSTSLAEGQTGQLGLRILDNENSVENSVDFLVRAYSFVKANNLDIGDFLKAYGWRPIATMFEILGGADFDIQESSKSKTIVVRRRVLRSRNGEKPVYGTKYVKKTVTKKTYNASGDEGFHSRAFGDVEDLFGLVNPTVTRLLNLSSDRRKIASRLDVRKRRRDAVRAYVQELAQSRGLIG